MLLDIALNCFHRKKKLKDHEEYMLKTGIIEESKKYKSSKGLIFKAPFHIVKKNKKEMIEMETPKDYRKKNK